MRSSHSVQEVGAVELRVSLNDQDYTPGPTPFHVFHGDPTLTPLAEPCRPPATSECARGFSPTSGPTDGGTRVLFVGEELGHGHPYVLALSGPSLLALSEPSLSATADLHPPLPLIHSYTCRFGNARYPLDPFYHDGLYSSDADGHYARLNAMLAGCSEDSLNSLLPPHVRGDAPTCAAPPALVAAGFSHDPYADRLASYAESGRSKAVVLANYVPETTASSDGAARAFRSATCIAPPASMLPVPADATTLVALELALNAQDYSRNAANASFGFTYYAPPAVLHLSPSSGPLSGATRVLVTGAQLDGGSDYRCAFGSRTAAVPAQPENLTAATLVCVTPPHVDAPELLDVTVTLNGQQYASRTAVFSVHAAVEINSLSPTSGPRLGATAIFLSGGPFANGSDYRCRFVPSGPSREYWRESAGVAGGAEHWALEAVNATVVGEVFNSSAVRCHAPPQLRPLVAQVEVTLNGQQYTSLAREYEYTESMLVVSSVSPASGPEHGGTRLIIRGYGMRLGAHYCCKLDDIVLPATFESGFGTPNPCREREDTDIASGFIATGNSGPATDSPSDCAARCAATAECTVWVRLLPSGACWMSSQLASTIGFTTRSNRTAALRCEPAAPPAPSPRALWDRTPGVPVTAATYVVDAVRCVTPDLAAPEMANQTLTPPELTRSALLLGRPLNVSLATNCQQYSAPHSAATFIYFGSPPESEGSRAARGWAPSVPPVPPVRAVPGQTDFGALPLEALGFRARELKVTGYQVAQLLQTSGFEPAELLAGGYSVDELRLGGFGASEIATSANASAAALRGGGFTAVELRAAGFTARALERAGYPHSALHAAGFLATAVSPTSGPNGGATNVTVFGGPFANGTDYRCRFAPLMLLVPATPSSDGVSLHCQSPALSTVQLALATPHSPPPPVQFITADDPAISQYDDVLPPVTGTDDEGAPRLAPYTVPYIHEGPLPGPYAEAARIAAAMRNAAAAAAADAAAEAATRLPPPGSLPVGAAPGALEVTLNGQQYSVDTFSYETYAVPSVSYLSPASGPTVGSTLLYVAGRQLTHGSHRLCRFALAMPSQMGAAEPSSGELGSGSAEAGSGEAGSGGGSFEDLPPLWAPLAVAGEVLLVATVDASVGVDGLGLLCRTPLIDSNRTQPSTVEVSLNGQQYTNELSRFDYFAPPTILAVYPLQGPAAGGTSLLLTGTGFHDFARANLTRRFPGALDDLRCRFGSDAHFVLARTTLVQEATVRCTSPPLAELGGSGELRFEFDAQPNASALLGDARIADGILILTQPVPKQVGTFIVRPDHHVPPPTAFDATFETLIGGGTIDEFDDAQLGM